MDDCPTDSMKRVTWNGSEISVAQLRESQGCRKWERFHVIFTCRAENGHGGYDSVDKRNRIVKRSFPPRAGYLSIARAESEGKRVSSPQSLFASISICAWRPEEEGCLPSLSSRLRLLLRSRRAPVFHARLNPGPSWVLLSSPRSFRKVVTQYSPAPSPPFLLPFFLKMFPSLKY